MCVHKAQEPAKYLRYNVLRSDINYTLKSASCKFFFLQSARLESKEASIAQSKGNRFDAARIINIHIQIENN